MNLVPPAAVALAALALGACQPQPAAEAQAPADPAIAAAVADVRSAAFDPVTGKARDSARGFATTLTSAPAASVPPTTLGDKGLMGRTLDAPPTETIGGETAF